MESPVLSIGMIVKNEIRCIEKCMKALQPLRKAISCELVIADTGSTDGTREIAEQYADILFDFPWVNDFSAARNAVMERCSGKWYLAIDADEYLDPNIDELRCLFCEPESSWPDTCLITVRNYLTPEMQEGVCSDFLVLRMARLGIGIRYRGTIHEVFSKNGRQLTAELIGCLPGIILHHDGYALESPEAQEAKARRNLDLLDKELEQHPDDLTRLGQCIESSSRFPNRRAAYVVQSAQVLQHADQNILQSVSAPGLAAHCALFGTVLQLPRAEEWIRWSKEHYPTHIATKLDTTFAEILLEYERKHYDRLPELTKKYLRTFTQYQKKDVPVLESATSVLGAADITHSFKVKAIASIALEKIGKSKKSLDMLTDWPIHQVPGEGIQDWVKALILHKDNPNAQELMAQMVHTIDANYMNAEVSAWEKRQRDAFQAICQVLFSSKKAESADEPEEAWRILLMSPGSFGLAAKVMAASDDKEISKFLSEVEDWDAFPPQALAHALKYGAIFPDSMAQQSVKWLQTTALTLAEMCEDFASLILSQKEKIDLDSLSQIQMLYWMLAAALMQKKNFSDSETALLLSEAYSNTAENFLNHCYAPEVLACKGACCALNEIDKFSLIYLTARSLQIQGDKAAYIRSLRSALRAAPQMKAFVTFLVEYEKKEMQQQVSPELLALAKNVRAILAQYPSNDPAVAALKQSAAYQKVAYLIEDVEL